LPDTCCWTHDDVHHLDAVGIYLARTGDLITWPAARSLKLLGATANLPALRVRARETLGA